MVTKHMDVGTDDVSSMELMGRLQRGCTTNVIVTIQSAVLPY